MASLTPLRIVYAVGYHLSCYLGSQFNQFIFCRTLDIRTHDSVLCGQAQPVRQVCINYTGMKKTPFSHICNLIIPERNCTMFAVESPSGYHSKFQMNPLIHHGDTRLQSSSYILRIFFSIFFFSHTLKNLNNSCILQLIFFKF